MLVDDIDLLRIEPRVFLDAAESATTLASATDGSVSGTTLSSVSSDFVSAGIDAGHVVVVNGEAVEVDARTDANTLEVSRPRVDSTQPKIEPTTGSALVLDVFTFARLIEFEHGWVLGALGIDPAHPTTPLDETDIVDTAGVERLIALRVIAGAYERAAAATPSDLALAQQASHFRELARRAAHQTVAYVDLDGDGVPDATRRIAVVTLTRQ